MPDQSAAISRLRELWDSPTPNQKISSKNVEVFDLPGAGPTIVPHPPQFQPAPQVVGTDVARALDQLMHIAPALQGRINRVQYGPTLDMQDAINGDYKSDDLPRLSVLGLTNTKTGNISLNPRIDPTLYGLDDPEYRFMPTLAHEATHAAGYHAETEPDEANKIVQHLVKSGYLSNSYK